MKKYIFKIALLALSLSTLVSCDEDTVTYGGQNFVTFDKVASTRLIAIEDKGDFATPINLAFPRSTDLVITVDVTIPDGSPAEEGVDFTIPSRTVTIPAGETSVNFIVSVINNDIKNDSKPIDITIKSTNDESVAVGISDIGSPYKKLVLLNEDCPTRFTELLGSFNVYNSDNEVIGKAEVDINDSGDCDVLRIKGVIEDVLQNETDTYIEITLKPIGTDATRGTVTGFQQLYCTECYNNSSNGFNETWLFTPGGSFNATSTNQQIVLTGAMVTASGSLSTTSTVVLKRN
ncbi:hypothetical protein ACX0HA_15915 [Flavobacterium hauense]